MTKLGSGWLVVGALAAVGCTTTVIGGSEAGGGIQDPEGSPVVDDGAGGSGPSTGSAISPPSSTTAGSGGAPYTGNDELPGPPEFGGAHRPAACPEGTQIALLTQHGDVLAYDPANDAAAVDFTSACGGRSMAMATDGTLFVQSGAIISTLDPSTGLCAPLPGYTQDPEFSSFAIGFVGDPAGSSGRIVAVRQMWSTEETLRMATVDPSTGARQAISDLHPEIAGVELSGGRGDRIVALASMADGRVLVLELDVDDATVAWTIEVPAVYANSFATARWGDFIYMFWGNTDGGVLETRVLRLDLATGAEEELGTIDGHAVMGSGTPDCAIPG